VLAWAFAYIQRDGEGEPSEDSFVVARSDAKPVSTFADRASDWLRDETGGSVYLRLSTRPIEQIKRPMTATLRQQIIDGGYWLRAPGPNCQVVVAFTGAVAPEAIQAVGLMAEDRRDVGLLAVTSADRLAAGWSAAQRARERGLVHARSHVERLLADVPLASGLVSVLDGHPATLAWLGSVYGHRTRALGVEHFGQTGTIPELYRHYGIDANAIVAAAQAIAPGRPIRHLKALP
jgi:pyruvate dehydrogenase E1 component